MAASWFVTLRFQVLMDICLTPPSKQRYSVTDEKSHVALKDSCCQSLATGGKGFKTLFEGRGSNTNHFKVVFMGFDLLFYTCSFNVLVYIEITAQFRSQIRSHMQLKVAAEGAIPIGKICDRTNKSKNCAWDHFSQQPFTGSICEYCCGGIRGVGKWMSHKYKASTVTPKCQTLPRTLKQAFEGLWKMSSTVSLLWSQIAGQQHTTTHNKTVKLHNCACSAQLHLEQAQLLYNRVCCNCPVFFTARTGVLMEIKHLSHLVLDPLRSQFW